MKGTDKSFIKIKKAKQKVKDDSDEDDETVEQFYDDNDNGQTDDENNEEDDIESDNDSEEVDEEFQPGDIVWGLHGRQWYPRTFATNSRASKIDTSSLNLVIQQVLILSNSP